MSNDYFSFMSSKWEDKHAKQRSAFEARCPPGARLENCFASIELIFAAMPWLFGASAAARR